ncbi:MAG: TonB-dependent receptor [Rhodanobacter sp.]
MASCMHWTGFVVSVLLLPVAALSGHAAEESPEAAPAPASTVRELPLVEVIGVTPLPELGLPLNQVPTAVQQATDKQLRQQHALNLGEFLNNNFNGVNINETQDNPFQMDVNYHGFKASPLLGAPEGLSVYQDGVRVNEAFGGTVNWDLIPDSSISRIALISGATSPVFGLNTLGGALSVQTKDGRSNPGTEAQVYGGSFGRTGGEFETGGTQGNFDYFLTANYFREDGWRDLSPSLVRQAFGKVGWQDDDTSVHLSYNWANNNMIGNGVTPRSMLAVRPQAILTAPDQTANKLDFANLSGSHSFNEHLLLSGNVYIRRLVTDSLNGDANDDYAGPSRDCAALAMADPEFDHDDLEDCATGINHRAREVQRTLGGGLQLSDADDLFGKQNRAVVGISFSRARNAFGQSQQLADLGPDRSTTIDAFPFNDPDVNPLQVVNDLSGHSTLYGMYVTDTFSPNELLHLTASARYDHDQEILNGASTDDDGDVHILAIDQSFHRLNPAFGLTLTPSQTLTFYASYNEGSRAPTVIELGCADPDIPCGLPNDFAADPPLEQVVARTFQAGARGSINGQRLMWNADLFRTRSSNDIQLIATSTSEGFFDNVGDTRRQGIDLGLSGDIGRLDWRLAYSYLDATYQSAFELVSGSNSSCVGDDDDDCLISIRPGDRLPLIQRHTVRLGLSYAATSRWNINGNVVVSSGQYLLGNENNANQAGGTTGAGDLVLGTGRIGGYAVVNVNTEYQVTPNVHLFLHVVNLFDRRYATSGFLTGNPFNPDGSFREDVDDNTQEDAISLAQPRAAWVGVRVNL